MATNRRALRERWFDAGASAVVRVSRGRSAGYGCPLCLDTYTRESAIDGTGLSVEDVPPASVGGRPLVLTCKTCNNTHGTTLDAHSVRRDRTQRFATGNLKPSEQLDAQLVSDGTRAPMRIRQGSGGEVLAFMNTKWSAPGRVMSAFDELGTTTTGPVELNLEVPWWSEKAADLSWFRAAYLVAFAMTGYRYITRYPALETLRQQLADPNADILTAAMLRNGRPEDARAFVVLDTPTELAGSFLITFGSRHIVLPGLTTDPSWTFERTQGVLQRLERAGEVRWSGPIFAMPTEALYTTDGDSE